MEINLNKKKNDILFTANKGYIDILLASIYSLLLNGELKNLRIHIISDGFDSYDYKRIEELITSFGDNEVYFYPLEEYDISKHNIPDWHGTQISNAKLFFGDILKPYKLNIENLLYLDADTITVGNLDDLEKYKNKLHAVKDACLNHYYKTLDGLSSYFNSGVIYFNVNEWMENDYQGRVVKLLEDNRINLSYPDQDIFNCAIRDDINSLPVKYNIPPHAYMFKGNMRKIYFNPLFRNVNHEEIADALGDPRIIHTYGLSGIKPWQTTFNPYHDEYMKYITGVNPDFQVKQIDGFKKIVTMLPFIYKGMLIARTYMNEPAEKYVRALSLKYHHSNNKNCQ